MPSVQNRSRFRVTVKNRDDLTKLFPYNGTTDVKAYVAELRAQNVKPDIDRTDDTFEVRIRVRGFKDQNITFPSLEDAESFINKVTEERKRGLFVDYTGGWKVTFADLVTRYIREEAPKHKAPRLANTKVRAATGAKIRESATSVEWINKPFAKLEPTDFEDYIKERLEVVAASTVDREVDLFSSICRIAYAMDIRRQVQVSSRR